MEGELCSDWFFLLRFKITGTNGGITLSSRNSFKLSNGTSGTEDANLHMKTSYDCFKKLAGSCFSNKLSTEEMMSRSSNEHGVIQSLCIRDFNTAVFDVGILGSNYYPYLAC